MNKLKSHLNSFSGRIALIVMIGIGLIAVTVSFVVLFMSRQVFSKNYGDSQEKVFEQIEKEFNDFHDHIENVFEAIDSSWAFRLYFGENAKLDNTQTFQNVYQMEQDLEKSKSADMERLNILVVGYNGKHYLSRTENICVTDEKILQSEPAQKAIAEPDIIHYTYTNKAYTTTSRNVDTVVVSKALCYHESKEIYAIAFVTLTMEELKPYYNYFVSDTTSFYMVDDNGMVLCSNEAGKIGTVLQTDWFAKMKEPDALRMEAQSDHTFYTLMKRNLPYQRCAIYALINNDVALQDLYNMPLLISICCVIGILIMMTCLFYTHKTMRPLSKLIGKMSAIREGRFSEYMMVEGTTEVQELASTYNYMLDDLKHYVEELVQTQKKQRQAEISALQMQINPHYIYNTLASIKWLVYQNDTPKTVRTIDAFISLLRNTISNSDEFISVSQEMINIQNYILINQTRYGDSIQVEYYISRTCEDCLLPKMILQPFIENTFFHAYPEGRCGTIQIVVKQADGRLTIQIIDDGIGMTREKVLNIMNEKTKKEHYSGIGVHNVQERLKLLYGDDYGINIISEEEKGTTVEIVLPINYSTEAENK